MSVLVHTKAKGSVQCVGKRDRNFLDPTYIDEKLTNYTIN